MSSILRNAVAHAVLAAGMITTGVVYADVYPPSVTLELEPGQSTTVDKFVDVPAIAPVLDFCLLIDLSGSYNDDLATIKGLAPDIVSGIRAEVADSTFCLASFVDFPFYDWGDSAFGDYAYRLDQDSTADGDAWGAAVAGLSIKYGADGPESQYEALYQMATGAGRDVPPPGDSLGDIPAGQDPSFRATASKVIAITTDAPFHTPDDSTCVSPSPPCPFGYPGASRNDTVDALNAAGIRVIAIKAPGAGGEMDDLAAATGGSVVTTDTSSSEIVEAILAGLAAIPQDITAEAVGCAPLAITFAPESYTGMIDISSVAFVETISVPADAPSATIDCKVVFKANDAPIGEQRILVTIAANKPPVCTAAYADPGLLWSPNHQFVAIDILGVTDPDGDEVTITVNSIRQDEAVNAKGTGNTCPDGQGVGTSTAQVRAERAGPPAGNGRVYQIGFTADDGAGGSCTGTVRVGVPHDKRPGGTPYDDGPKYDSTTCP
jgi:hypothetical protein